VVLNVSIAKPTSQTLSFFRVPKIGYGVFLAIQVLLGSGVSRVVGEKNGIIPSPLALFLLFVSHG
jgi:hypothetical protein